MTERPTTHQEKLEAMQGILDGWDRAVEERRDKRAAQNPPQNQSMPDLQPGQCVITKDNMPQGLPVPEQHIDKALINLRETQKKLEQTLPPSMRGQVQTPTYGKYCNQSNTAGQQVYSNVNRGKRRKAQGKEPSHIEEFDEVAP